MIGFTHSLPKIHNSNTYLYTFISQRVGISVDSRKSSSSSSSDGGGNGSSSK